MEQVLRDTDNDNDVNAVGELAVPGSADSTHEVQQSQSRGMVILDPEWLAEAMRCIITYKQGFVEDRYGLFIGV